MNAEETFAAGTAGLIIGLISGWFLWGAVTPEPAPIYVPEIVQRDGSKLLEVKPTTKPSKPPHTLPKGAKEERRVQVVVQPPKVPIFHDPGITAGADKKSLLVDSCECPPVTVNLSLIRLADNSRRVQASSPDGTIVAGVDVPIEPQKPAKTHPWAIGGVYTYDGANRFGAFIDRDLGPFRLGGEVFQSTSGFAIVGKVGIRF
jgi:hypothetical protein